MAQPGGGDDRPPPLGRVEDEYLSAAAAEVELRGLDFEGYRISTYVNSEGAEFVAVSPDGTQIRRVRIAKSNGAAHLLSLVLNEINIARNLNEDLEAAPHGKSQPENTDPSESALELIEKFSNEQAARLRRIGELAAHIDDLRADLDEQARLAVKAGASYAELGRLVGISHAAAYQRWAPGAKQKHAERQRRRRRPPAEDEP